ncbi:hypothetical protein H6F67_22850 [Microcoleus sp. FACHB-1515]|uniref:hypothetical protein n=1 Tax=Cyanophyceae TaxID=3028117 RepID=UPI00168602AB|nr:hypothetical protein [Microcoleus sp. FACHB-1515]MBD2092694.1 hypothetical protein [Microcoleus sp. FACHB-1515]
MTDYTPYHGASESLRDEERISLNAEASEGENWLDEQSEEVDFYEALDEDWLIEDLSDRAQAYEQSDAEVRSTDVPFPELIEAAIQVMQAAQDAGIEF